MSAAADTACVRIAHSTAQRTLLGLPPEGEGGRAVAAVALARNAEKGRIGRVRVCGKKKRTSLNGYSTQGVLDSTALVGRTGADHCVSVSIELKLQANHRAIMRNY